MLSCQVHGLLRGLKSHLQAIGKFIGQEEIGMESNQLHSYLKKTESLRKIIFLSFLLSCKNVTFQSVAFKVYTEFFYLLFIS